MMDYKVVVMPRGGFEGLRGRLVSQPDDSEHRTFIETVSCKFYPVDLEWVYAANKAARNTLKKAGFTVRNVLGSVMYIDVI